MSSSTMSQALYLGTTLFKLKGFKGLWFVVVIVAVFSNHFLFPLIEHWMGNFGHILSVIDGATFFHNTVIMLEAKKMFWELDVMLKMIEEATGNKIVAKSALEECLDSNGCYNRMFKSLYGRYNTSKYLSYIDYGEDVIAQQPKIFCQVSYGADLNCPYLGHLVASTKYSRNSLHRMGYRFKEVEFFSLTAPAERTSISQKTRDTNSWCAQHESFDPVFSRTAMIQTIILINCFCFYILIGTVSCITDLKKNGFLKLLFRKGLSVKAFWIAVWSIAILEVFFIAMLFTVSHAFQCLNFYNATSLLMVFLGTVWQLFAIVACGLLATVIFSKYFYMGLTLALLAICASAFTIVVRLLLSSADLARVALLVLMPIGHLGEFTRAQLLTVILPDGVTYYHHMILVMSFLFTIGTAGLTHYLDYILKTGNGWCMPTGYVFNSRFWSYSPDVEVKPPEDPLADEALPNLANVEPVVEGLNPIVRTSHLGKNYITQRCFSNTKQVTVALNDFTAHIYESQITAIIGHNGSGKTTLLNIMNGTDSPTSGHVSVNGLLINDPINRMRLNRFIGICPQENSLSNALTVNQIKELVLVSCNRSFDDPEAKYLLNALHIDDKSNLLTSRISDGTKRKLCTAIALIGDTKLLFLDEPTSGVDPVSRRRVWKLLQKYKKKCSIILSTQAMDEADTLADRKIFLSGGAMICAGSSIFLKSAFDCGFDFNVTLKTPSHAPMLIKQMQEDFRNVKIKNQFRTNVDFRISASDLNDLPAFAQALERRMSFIEAFGLLQASLYDIFMRLRDLLPKDVENLFREGRIDLVSEEEAYEASERGSVLIDHKFHPSSEKNVISSVLLMFYSIARVNFIRIVRSRVKLGSRVFTPFLLLSILVAMAFVENDTNTLNLNLKNIITNWGDHFQRGVCVYSADATAITKPECASVLFTGNRTDLSNILVLEVPKDYKVYEFLRESQQIEKIKSVCPFAATTECPILYTNDWKTNRIIDHNSVKIGSFSTYEKFNSSLAASVTIGGYTRLLTHILYLGRSPQSFPNDSFLFEAESIYSFRDTFIPLYSIFVQLIILTLIPATFLDDLIEDKETMVRTQLSSMGVGLFSYWITIFSVHWIQYASIYILSVIFVVSINSTGYANGFYLAGVVLPTILVGLANNQLTVYILSSFMKKSNPIVTVAYFFFSIFLVIVILTAQLENILGIVLIVLVPPVASISLTFYGTKVIFYTLSYFSSREKAESNIKEVFFFHGHIIASVVLTFVHSLVLLTILSVLENRLYVSKLISALRSLVQYAEEEKHQDPGVIEEIKRIEETVRNPDNLFEARHVRLKIANGARILRDVTFATSPGEIFGLLGPNGAGKSTSMAIMVGNLKATEGRCEVQSNERWYSSRLAARKGLIGYCPQYNPLYPDVTVREHLEFYGNVLGVGQADFKETIDVLLKSLELDKYEDKKTSELSFGFRRRLSLAAALLGDPCLLVIDEASTGVDPEGKRILWQSIRSLAGKQRCIVVSTHSMEEAEALCSRVCVMNFGSLVGLGSVQQLKSRYGQSYTLEVLLDAERDEPAESLDMKRGAIVDAVLKKFVKSSVVEDFTNRVTFSIPQASVGRLSHALAWLAEIKKSSRILYFSFYQMSLDQVFARMISLHNRQLAADEQDEVSSDSVTDFFERGRVSVSEA